MSLYPRHSYPSKRLQSPWRRAWKIYIARLRELTRSHLRGTPASTQSEGSKVMNCLKSRDWVGTVTIIMGTKGSGSVD